MAATMETQWTGTVGGFTRTACRGGGRHSHPSGGDAAVDDDHGNDGDDDGALSPASIQTQIAALESAYFSL